MKISHEKHNYNGYCATYPYCKKEIRISIHDCEKIGFDKTTNICQWCLFDKKNQSNTKCGNLYSRQIDCCFCGKLFYLINKNEKIIQLREDLKNSA